jgi:hypothetical protein
MRRLVVEKYAPRGRKLAPIDFGRVPVALVVGDQRIEGTGNLRLSFE